MARNFVKLEIIFRDLSGHPVIRKFEKLENVYFVSKLKADISVKC